jgi:hypothetical protein
MSHKVAEHSACHAGTLGPSRASTRDQGELRKASAAAPAILAVIRNTCGFGREPIFSVTGAWYDHPRAWSFPSSTSRAISGVPSDGD